MNDPMETTMATAKRNRDKTDTEHETGTPNPYEKKAHRSILKGKVRKEKDEKTMMNEEEEASDDDIAMPPKIKRDKGSDNNDIKTDLSFTFEQINNSEESTAKNQKNESGNEEAKKINEEGEEEKDNEEGKQDTGEELGFFIDDKPNEDDATKKDGHDNKDEEADDTDEEQIDKEAFNEENINDDEEDKEPDGNKKGKDAGNNNKTGGVEEEKDNQKDDYQEKKDDEQKKNDNDEGDEDKMTDEEKQADAMDEDKYVLDLQGKTFKQHTSMWKTIPEGVMNASKIFTFEDYDYIFDVLEDISKDMNADLDIMDKEKWIKVFIQTKDISASRNKKRYIRIFGVSLASSNPAEMFNKNIFDGNKLLETAITTVWAAAYSLYGPGWIREVIDLGQKVKAPTKLFQQSFSVAEARKAEPFLSSEVYGDSPGALHNIESSMRKICKVKPKFKEVMEPKAWMTAMTKQLRTKTSKARNICLRLAKTPVSIFQEHHLLRGTQLEKVAVTVMWAAAYELLGQIVNEERSTEDAPPKAPPKSPPKTTPTSTPTRIAPATKITPTSEATSPAVMFDPEVKEKEKVKEKVVKKKPGNQLFLSLAKPEKAVTKIKLSKRKHNGFYKVKLPATVNEFGTKAIDECMSHISNLTEALWTIDKKAEILPWYDDNNVKPFAKGTTNPKTKEELNKYTPSVFIKQGQNTWLRFNIAHDVDKEKFVDTDLFSKMKLQLSYDKVQAKKTSTWGWLLGGIPETANLIHLKLACEAHPVLSEFQIEARTQVIKLFSGKQDTPVNLQVKAIHIIGDDRVTAKGRKAFNKVFGSRNDSGYPQQRVMRFVPNIADNRFPASQSRIRDVVKMVGKQKKIIKDSKPIFTDTICGLHYRVPELGYTLCQILMSMRSANDPDTQLFMAVDERPFGTYAVAFTVHKDRMAEATSLVPLLNVVLEAKFGARIWNWFTDTAKDASQGYVYDQVTGCLKNVDENDSDVSSIGSDDDDFVKELSERFNISSGNNDKGDKFDLDLSFMLEDEQPKNQYGDSGSVKTFREKDKVIEIGSSDDEEDAPTTNKDEEIPTKANESSNLISPKATPKEKPTETVHGTMSVDTSQTKESTLSDSMKNPEQAFARMCLQNPDFLARFLTSNPDIKTASTGESKTPAKNTDPQNASQQEEGDEAS